MRVRRLILGMLDTNCWLVSDDTDGPLVVIDPAGDSHRDANELLQAIGNRQVAAVVLTHAHFDHLGSARTVVEATGAPLLAHALDADRLTSAGLEGTGGAPFGFDHVAPPADRVLQDGDVIVAGTLTLNVISTPGHTRGSIGLLVQQGCKASGDQAAPHLFSGDTLFAGSVGRTDFPGGAMLELQRSIARLASLSDDTIVHPGHGPDTTIGRERRVNPFFPRA